MQSTAGTTIDLRRDVCSEERPGLTCFALKILSSVSREPSMMERGEKLFGLITSHVDIGLRIR